jgi:hypothetical protein
MYRHAIHLLQKHLLQCPVKALLHIDCPGCGLQRAIVAALKGHAAESWHLYPPGIFILTLLMFLCLHLKFSFKYGADILKYIYISTAIAILANYIFKITTHIL